MQSSSAFRTKGIAAMKKSRLKINWVLKNIYLGLLLISPPLQSAGIILAPKEPPAAKAYSPTAPVWKVSSVFGPRAEGSLFHAGIDYNLKDGDADEGVIIKALAKGTIELIERHEKGYYISIRSTFGSLQYVHIFKNSSKNEIEVAYHNVTDGLYSKVVLKKISFASAVELPKITLVTCNAIYFYDSIGRIKKILTTTQCEGINVIDPVTGEFVTATSRVEVGEDIAPLGKSGPEGMTAHLHLGFNRRKDNPLAIVEHTESQLFTVTLAIDKYDATLLQYIMKKPGFGIIVEDKALVPDLDKLIVSGPVSKGPATEFVFGGKEAMDIINADKDINIKPDLILNFGTDLPTIKPFQWNGAGGPRVMSFFVPYPDMKKLAPGEHTLDVQVMTVTGKSYPFSLKFSTTGFAVVTSVEPNEAHLGHPVEIIVKGKNLGEIGQPSVLKVALEDCPNMQYLGGTSTEQHFQCTPMTSGTMEGSVTTAATLHELQLMWIIVKKYFIGDIGPAGGFVIYVDGTGEHGLEAAPVDQGSSIEEDAAQIAANYSVNGYTDWYLPSSNDVETIDGALSLEETIRGKKINLGFADTEYWSIPAYSYYSYLADDVAHFSFAGAPNKNGVIEFEIRRVRAIRTF